MEKNEFGPEHEYRFLVVESYLDTFGHMNNAIYLTLFEEARWDIITAGGYGLDVIQELKIGPIITSVSVQYKREIKNREWITIRSRLKSVQSKIMTMQQIMINERNEEACVAEFSFGLFDMKLRKLISPSEKWLSSLGVSPNSH